MIGWLGLPDTDYTIPTKTWMHALTLPRELRFEDGRLKRRVIEELRRTRADRSGQADESAGNLRFKSLSARGADLDDRRSETCL
ncbi:MAG: hypothetical protein ACLSFJ_03355 [Holdemania filiformis]